MKYDNTIRKNFFSGHLNKTGGDKISMPNKIDIIREYISDKITDVSTVQYDLDIRGITIPDIFRDINNVYPIGTRERDNIKEGRFVIGVLCVSEYLEPYKGIIFLLSNDKIEPKGESSKYIVIAIDQFMIQNDDYVCLLSRRITEYLIKNFADYMPKFKEFYVRYLYDDYEKVRSSLTDYGFDIV